MALDPGRRNMGDPITLGQVLAGQATGQGMGVIGNFINGGISRFFKKQALLNDPSNYLKGMEKAGLNPLTMGNQTPAQVGQSTVNSQMSSPTEAMMAGVNLAKAFSEIEQNKASAAKDREETESQHLKNIAQEATNDAMARNWTVDLGRKKIDVSGYDAQIAHKLQQLQREAIKATDEGIYSSYLQEAYNWVSKNSSVRNPEIIKLRAQAIALTMLNKDNRWYAASKIGQMLGGASAGIGSALIKGAMMP
jgi:hypothetical protein